MTWYKLVLEQKQPIHIGFKKYGVLAETRIFIPGQTIWGALTKAYNLMKGDMSNIDERLFEQITCFYPLLDGDTILKPNFKNGEFHLGEISEKEFRLLFVDSFTSTSILSETRTAKDESLHEIEYILPKPKYEILKKMIENIEDNKEKDTEKDERKLEILQKFENINNLKWVGLINIDKDTKKQLENLNIFIGGDSRYGYGLMKIKQLTEVSNELGNKFDIDKKPIKGKLGKYNNADLLNYLEFDPKIKFEGKLELLPEFDFYNGGVKIDKAQYYITPGSTLI
jgi:hypothetical protein